MLQLAVGKEAALKGALSGLIGGMAIKLVWQAGQRAFMPEERRVWSPTAEVVRKLAERSGKALTTPQARMTAAAVYGGTMLAYGTVYGMMQQRKRPAAFADALLLATMMYAANFPRFGVLPRMGILQAPGEQAPREAAVPVAAQLAYAGAMAFAFRALGRLPRSVGFSSWRSR